MATSIIHEYDRWPRPEAAPAKAEVKGWDYPQFAQAEDIAANKYINQKVHGMATSVIHINDDLARAAAAPTQAEVAGWPYPQYAQVDPLADKTREGKEIMPTANDGHFHYP